MSIQQASHETRYVHSASAALSGSDTLAVHWNSDGQVSSFRITLYGKTRTLSHTARSYETGCGFHLLEGDVGDLRVTVEALNALEAVLGSEELLVSRPAETGETV